MTPTASSPDALARMKRQGQRDTVPELALRRELWQRGLRYRLHSRVPGTRRTIDIAFPGSRVAVFVNGCFWHSCPTHGTRPRANSRWWEEKLESNSERDTDTDKRLSEAGWVSIRVWEHDDPRCAAKDISALVRARGQQRGLSQRA